MIHIINFQMKVIKEIQIMIHIQVNNQIVNLREVKISQWI